MNKLSLILLILQQSLFQVIAQEKYDCFLNMTVPYQNEYEDVVKVLGKYILSKDNWVSNNPYWSKKEAIEDGYFQKKFINEINHSYYGNFFYKPTIIDIDKIDLNKYIIKVAFMHAEASGFCRLASIMNFIVLKEEYHYVLKSIQSYNIEENYIQTTSKYACFFKKKDTNKIPIEWYEKCDSINVVLATFFNTPQPLKFKCYLLNDVAERSRLWGFDFDYDIANGGNADGITFLESNEMYLTGNNIELFIHELVHLYTHAKFGNLTHTFFKEGVASLIGQCAYKNISTEQHFKNIAIWVKNNPNYKFDDLLNLKDFDKITNVSFSIAALLCKDIQNQKGKGGLFRVLYGGETDNELYETLEQVLNLKRANIDTYIKNELKKYE